MLGKHFSDESKQKMREKKVNIPLLEEHKKNIGLAVSKRFENEEERQKQSDRLKGRPSPMKGRKWSPEMREKILKSRIGKKRGPYKKKSTDNAEKNNI